MPLNALYRTSYPHFMTTTFAIMRLHALYSVHQMHYIWKLTYSEWCHIHYMWYITKWLYNIKPYKFMTYSLYMVSHTVLWPQTIVCLHSHYAWHYTQTIFDITQNVPSLWQKVKVSHHSLYMYDNIGTTYDITSTLYDITPLYLGCQVHYI